MKILLAEDDLNIAKIVLMTLQHVGQHEVLHVENGQLVIDEIKKNPLAFDLILLDEMMPKLGGIKTCQTLLELNITTPIIFMTANNSPEMHDFLKQNNLAMITKPFEPLTLNDQIQEILNKGERS